MNAIDILFKRIEEFNELPAFFLNSKIINYKEFNKLINEFDSMLTTLNIGHGTVCSILGDFSPKCCALFFSLLKRKSIVVPLTKSVLNESDKLKRIAGVQVSFEFDDNYNLVNKSENNYPENQLINKFKKSNNQGGIVVFTSGSTGEPKGILHNFERVMKKFTIPRKRLSTVQFLLMDHFGGINTLLATLSHGGLAVCVNERDPVSICKTIEDSKANLLPTTPTFLNLLIASRAYMSFDLSSIKLITYGTEVMMESTLKKIRKIFPNAILKQTYGLSELGVLRSQSKNKDSVWVKIGGEGYDVKIIDSILWIKSEANMEGYLNAPSPFDKNGWMCTGDQVELNGEYLRIIGRKSEIINVGGQKVFPAEVESILLEDENIKEVTVYGVKNNLMGEVVHANVSLYVEETSSEFRKRITKYCNQKLTKYKIPIKFNIIQNEIQHNERYKKIRKGLK